VIQTINVNYKKIQENSFKLSDKLHDVKKDKGEISSQNETLQKEIDSLRKLLNKENEDYDKYDLEIQELLK